MNKDYEILSILYKTNKSTIYKIKYFNKDTIYCLKSYNVKKIVYNEIEILSQLHHQNIVKFYNFIDTKIGKNIIFEYCSFGDLSDITRINNNLDEYTIAHKIVTPILYALEYIHSKSVIHCDIKPENIFITSDGYIRIGDFENSINTLITTPNIVCGTYEFMSPEMAKLALKTEEELEIIISNDIPVYDYKIDIWSFGILLYELIYDITPFYSSTTNNMLFNIINKPITYKKHKYYSSQCLNFLIIILNRNISSRPSASELLLHPWIQKNHIYKSLSAPQLNIENGYNIQLSHTKFTSDTTLSSSNKK